jgi:inner membrane transporter RhtA
MDSVVSIPERARHTPVPVLFVLNSFFHYFGPAVAVLLFAHIGVSGAVWLRIVSAALVFAVWRRPWKRLSELTGAQAALIVVLGSVLTLMNAVFYLAIDRLPLSTVGAVEFLGIVALAALGIRTRRNACALGLAVCGVAVLTDIRLTAEPWGFVYAFANCVLFAVYVALGHRVANSTTVDRVDQLGLAMIAAAVLVMPVLIVAHSALGSGFRWIPAGLGVGLCSSVVPYVIDQVIMGRLTRASFALQLSILPATAAVIGLVVLTQVPTLQDIAGIGLVIAGVIVHQEGETA